MERVYLYDNWDALSKNPPAHGEIDDMAGECFYPLRPLIISSSETYGNGEYALQVKANCPEHGEITYFVRFIK